MPRPTTTILFDVFELAPGTGKSIGIYHYARNLLREMLATLEPGMHVVVAVLERYRHLVESSNDIEKLGQGRRNHVRVSLAVCGYRPSLSVGLPSP